MKCLLLKNKIQLWLTDEKLKKLLDSKILNEFNIIIEVCGEYINTNDVSGIFSKEKIEELERRHNGQWKCDKGNWHDRFDKCNCRTQKEIEFDKKVYELSSKCNKCDNGYISRKFEQIECPNIGHVYEKMFPCSCIEHLFPKLKEELTKYKFIN